MSKTNWHETPEAQEILARVKNDPPAIKRWTAFNPHNRGMAEFTSYVGAEVDQLEKLRQTAGNALLDTPEFDDWAKTPTVEKLISDALEQERAI